MQHSLYVNKFPAITNVQKFVTSGESQSYLSYSILFLFGRHVFINSVCYTPTVVYTIVLINSVCYTPTVVYTIMFINSVCYTPTVVYTIVFINSMCYTPTVSTQW